MGSQFEQFLSDSQTRINQHLESVLPSAEGEARYLHEAVRYAVLNGGKRVRPLLCYAAAYAVSGSTNSIDPVAASLEMIHAYSLVHDDLPAMDDDDLRRGKPTCHIAFDEATAILTGDALQTLAFEQLTTLANKQPATQLTLIQTLAQAAGPKGMVGGQAVDISSVNKQLNLEQLQQMHQAKTGALLSASILMGALATEQCTAAQQQSLKTFGDAIGLAFQIQDDVLDELSDTQTLGKQQGADQLNNKPTYTSLLGVEKAQQAAQDLLGEARNALSEFGENAFYLRALADYIVTRTH